MSTMYKNGRLKWAILMLNCPLLEMNRIKAINDVRI